MRYQEAAEELRSNTDQWRAYESQGNCVVLAGPGSGKTKVLTIKMARFVAEDVRRPAGIACVTYNNECVRELRKRLDRLGVEESDRVFVGTLHAFCLQYIIGPYARLAGEELPSRFRIASDIDVVRIVGDALTRLNIGAKPTDMRTGLDKFRRLTIDRTIENGWEPGDRGLTDICIVYEATLQREALVDFDTMVLTALRLVENNDWVCRCLEAKFPILIIDEYQDLGLALHRLVDRLCLRSEIRLFAVGDPDQSIYGFTGARPELLKSLAQHPEVEEVRLRLNYRSARTIIAAAKAALGEDREYAGHRDSRGAIEFYERNGGVEGQVSFLVEELLPALLGRHRAGNIVILHPSFYEGGIIEERLRTADHEFVRLGRNAAYSRTPLTRLVEELARWCSGGWKAGDPRLSRLLARWTGLLELTDPRDRRHSHQKLVRFLFEHREPEVSAGTWLADLESSAMLGDDLQQRLADAGQLDSFQELLEAAKPDGPLAQFTVRNLAGQAGSVDHLNVLTLHSSKGTEYEVVVIVGADEGRVPSVRTKTAEAMAEQRRLFYVAVSRAKEEVHILYSPPIDDYFQQGPSRFVVEVMEAIGAADHENEPTEDFL